MGILNYAKSKFVTNIDRFRRIAHAVEATALVLVIAASGATLTWWYMSKDYEARVVLIRADHAAELKRLTDAYGLRLTNLGEKVDSAAATAQTAASTAAVAVEGAHAATDTAEKAAAASSQAATKAAQAANQARQATERVPQPTVNQINKAVDAANRQIDNRGNR